MTASFNGRRLKPLLITALVVFAGELKAESDVSHMIVGEVLLAESETACNSRCYKSYDNCRSKSHPKADPRLCDQSRSGCLKACMPPYRRPTDPPPTRDKYRQ